MRPKILKMNLERVNGVYMKIMYYFKSFLLAIANPSRLNNVKKFKYSSIGYGCHIIDTDIGNFSYFAHKTKCINAEIGRYCSIGSLTFIGGAEHPTNWVSTSPVFYDNRNPCKTKWGNLHWNSFAKRTIIGSDVWVGDNVIIKAGVKIGNGAIIGMGSVVTKNVPDFEIWAGNPAKYIRKRFDNETIALLNTMKWWDKNPNDLDFENFDNLKKFFKKIELKQK